MIKQRQLSDLDELLLTVRNKNSEIYIEEAIMAYRTGACRAALVSTWIAVSYDIISKLRELASHNDPNATSIIKDFDELIGDSNEEIQKQNIPKLQALENSLLDKAKNEFEFISLQEHEDLNRLKKDRNLCAHPAYTSDDLLFQPTPELVRTHIVHAISHLLQREPVQGKSAIDRVLADIESRGFPLEEDNVFTFLKDKYLARAKDVFIRNLLIALIKRLFSKDFHYLYKQKIVLSIKAIKKSNHSIYLAVLEDKISHLFNSLDDSNFANIFHLLRSDFEIWDKLESHCQIKIGGYISSLSDRDLNIMEDYKLFYFLNMPVLKENLINMFKKLSADSQYFIIRSMPHPYFSEQAIALYSNARSYRGAESLGADILLPIASYLTVEQIKSVINSAKNNGQIFDAAGTPEIMAEFFDLTKKCLNEIKIDWIDFINSRLRFYENEDDYDKNWTYPKLRKLMEDYNIEWRQESSEL